MRSRASNRHRLKPGVSPDRSPVFGTSGIALQHIESGRALGLLLSVLLIPVVALGDQDPSREEPAMWWSLAPLERPALPALSAEDAQWVETPVDAFVVSRLRQHGLAPSQEADRRTLIRRLYYDLIGLPPSPSEIHAFMSDPDPLAYERLVERLLDSPRYGERWARYWLDVVHYGDTHGYDKDKPRPNAWPYRDYVIRSFNEDKPYSRFVCEQIAGDALYPGSPDGIIATGFIAAGPWDFVAQAEVPETKIDGQIARHLDRDDMVATTMNTFVSATVQCAQCHDHKFDPISQEDYYSLHAVFAALDRADRPYDLDPEVGRRRSVLLTERNQAASARASLAAKLAKLGSDELAALDREIKEARSNVNTGVHPELGYHSRIENSQNAVKWVQVDLGSSVTISRLALEGCYDDFNNIGAGFGFPVRFKIELSDDADFREGVRAVFNQTDADFPNPKTNPQTVQIDGARARFVRITATKLALRKDDYIFALGELSVFNQTGKNVALEARVTALDSIESPPRWQRKNLVDDIYYGAGNKAEDADKLAGLMKKREELARRIGGAELERQLREAELRLKGLNGALDALPEGGKVYAGTVHYGSGNFRGTGANGGKPRVIHLLRRGNVVSPGPIVGPGTLSVFNDLPSRFEACNGGPEEERRKALARWITDPRNSLTWRSIVNRIWLYHFGRGIVDTPNDFGRMGQRPSHPELLDWLAVEFRDGGQSIKDLHRLLVDSATYRQASAWDSASAALDSENRFYWKMNRRRLDAEAIRDSALFVSGALDETMYGSGFQDFVIEKPEHSPHYEYRLHDADDRRAHRRAIYRFLVRSQPQPFMAALDCADPSMQVDKRTETYTVLQALALLNDKFMIAMAEHFAARLSGVEGDAERRARAGFEMIAGRPPTPDEAAELAGYAREHGLANLCRVLFNLNEFVFVD